MRSSGIGELGEAALDGQLIMGVHIKGLLEAPHAELGASTREVGRSLYRPGGGIVHHQACLCRSLPVEGTISLRLGKPYWAFAVGAD